MGRNATSIIKHDLRVYPFFFAPNRGEEELELLCGEVNFTGTTTIA